MKNSIRAISCIDKRVFQMSATIPQTLFYSFSKIFHHLSSHLLRDCWDFSLFLCFSYSMVLGLEIKFYLWDIPMESNYKQRDQVNARPWNNTAKRNDVLSRRFSQNTHWCPCHFCEPDLLHREFDLSSAWFQQVVVAFHTARAASFRKFV